MTREAGSGAVVTKSAASSPEIVSHASPPATARWPTNCRQSFATAAAPAAPDKAAASGSATPATDRAAAAKIPSAAAPVAASSDETLRRGSPDGWCSIRRSADDDVGKPGREYRRHAAKQDEAARQQ